MALDDVKGDDCATEGSGTRRAQFRLEVFLFCKIGLGTAVVVWINGSFVLQIAAGQINEWVGDT